jgi:hypothetical protein
VADAKHTVAGLMELVSEYGQCRWSEGSSGATYLDRMGERRSREEAADLYKQIETYAAQLNHAGVLAPGDMRAEFKAWVESQGCDTDGAWSAWQAAWNLRAPPSTTKQEVSIVFVPTSVRPSKNDPWEQCAALLLNPCDGFHLVYAYFDGDGEFDRFSDFASSEPYADDFYVAWAMLPDESPLIGIFDPKRAAGGVDGFPPHEEGSNEAR